MRSDAIRTPVPSAAANVVANVNTAQIFPLLQTPLLAASIALPASGVLASVPFELVAAGLAFTNGAFTLLATLYAAIALPAAPLVAANWTILGAAGAVALNGNGEWTIRARMQCGAKLKKLQGSFDSMINNTVGAPAAITNQVAVNDPTGAVDPVCFFAVGVTFNTADAANYGQLNYFGLEA